MRARTFLHLIVAALLLGGCGVPIEREPERLSKIPFGLSAPEETETPESPSAAEGSVAQVYFVDSARNLLTPVDRRLPDPTLPAIVQSLLRGPTRAESRLGLTSAFPTQDLVDGVELAGGVAGVNLASGFTVLDASMQRLAIAQLVVTLTGRPGVGRVAFALEGQPIDIPRGDGTLVAGSVSRDDYRELLPS